MERREGVSGGLSLELSEGLLCARVECCVSISSKRLCVCMLDGKVGGGGLLVGRMPSDA